MVSFDLENYLKARRTMIDRALDRYLKGQQGQAHSIWKAARYGLFSGGKRIRPILTVAAGEVFGGKLKDLLPFACAVEMIHAYSLIHDDLPALDDDDLRRGQPSVHKVFGEGMALLAGDGLLTEAFHLISAPQGMGSISADSTLQLIHELAHAAGIAGLVGGQALDLQAESQEADLATVEYIHVRKTGALILASVRIGARIAAAKPAELRRISRYGEFFGLAFQIADDILDAEGHTAEGARIESARKERKKATYPSVVGLAQARERLAELYQQCLKELSSFGPAAEPLRAIARASVARAMHNTANSVREEMNA